MVTASICAMSCSHLLRGATVRLSACVQAQGADVVIALTHSRRPNDIICARDIAGIDLVLGGTGHCHRVAATALPQFVWRPQRCSAWVA